MSLLDMDRGSLAGRVVARLRHWPALLVRITDGADDVGSTGSTGSTGGEPVVTAELVDSGRVILVVERGDHARLHLTRPVARRLRDALAEHAQVSIEPDEEWAGVRMHTAGDVEVLLSLVSVAIKAHTSPVRA